MTKTFYFFPFNLFQMSFLEMQIQKLDYYLTSYDGIIHSMDFPKNKNEEQ